MEKTSIRGSGDRRIESPSIGSDIFDLLSPVHQHGEAFVRRSSRLHDAEADPLPIPTNKDATGACHGRISSQLTYSEGTVQ